MTHCTIQFSNTWLSMVQHTSAALILFGNIHKISSSPININYISTNHVASSQFQKFCKLHYCVIIQLRLRSWTNIAKTWETIQRVNQLYPSDAI